MMEEQLSRKRVEVVQNLMGHQQQKLKGKRKNEAGNRLLQKKNLQNLQMMNLLQQSEVEVAPRDLRKKQPNPRSPQLMVEVAVGRAKTPLPLNKQLQQKKNRTMTKKKTALINRSKTACGHQLIFSC